MKIRKCFVIIIVLLLLTSSILGTVEISAEDNISWYRPLGNQWYYAIPLAYETTKTITYIDGLDVQMNTPTDMYLAEDGYIYIVDHAIKEVIVDGEKKNITARIIKLDKSGNLQKVYDDEYGMITQKEYEEELKDNNAKYGKDESVLKHYNRISKAKLISGLDKPEGIYVDKDGDLFIADTQNSRILHLSNDGEFIELFHEPEESTYNYDIHPFFPSKVAIDTVGRLYIVNTADYQGFTTLDYDNKFLGYVAQTKIEYDFWYEIIKNIYSQQVLEKIFARTTPPFLSNFVFSKYDKNLIYAVARNDVKNQIKKLTPAGNNIFKDGIYGYVDTYSDPEKFLYADYIDITVGKTGLIYAINASMQEIDVYDQEGNNVAVIGERGNRRGAFSSVSAIDTDEDNNLYVLDAGRNAIQIMEPTKFMDKVLNATELYQAGKYKEALEPWQEILQIHNTYKLALTGLAKAKFGQLEYEAAMDLYKLALDTDGYSEAFYEYRLEAFRENFGAVVGVILVIVIALFFLLSYLRKLSSKVDLVYNYSDDKYGIKIFFHTLLLVIFHPIDAFNKLKANREKYKLWSIVVIYFAIVIVLVSYIYLVHYPLAKSLPQFTDFVQEILLMLLPITAWIIVGFAITSISNGKTKFKETCISVLFSFTPYIIFTIPLGLLSNIMAGTESGLYTALQAIILLWCFALTLLSLMNLNEYSFKQMVWNTIKIIFALACIIMIFGMVYVVISQFVTFVEEINVEILYMGSR